MPISFERGDMTLPIAQVGVTSRHQPIVPDSVPHPIASSSPCPSGQARKFLRDPGHSAGTCTGKSGGSDNAHAY